jgi:hypothetical protein
MELRRQAGGRQAPSQSREFTMVQRQEPFDHSSQQARREKGVFRGQDFSTPELSEIFCQISTSRPKSQLHEANLFRAVF